MESILDDLGSQIIAIVTPVSICMLLVVLMVRGLTPKGSDEVGPVIGALVYHEQSTDTNVQKFEGALLNAAFFIVTVTVVTFGLVGCFWLRCTRLIWGYMGFSGFTILTWLGGTVAVQFIQLWSIPIDLLSFSLLLYNFSVIGVLAVFFCRMPIFLNQTYLVIIGSVVAFWFTHLPEWTTWLLLVAMALYDLVAVLAPGGPLKMLLDLANERDEEIPALIYESRPPPLKTKPPKAQIVSHGQSSSQSTSETRREAPEKVEIVEENITVSSEIEASPIPENSSSLNEERRESEPLISQEMPNSQGQSEGNSTGRRSRRRAQSNHRKEDFSLPDAIKLGLGDFIFYSVLVGRAAMFDLLTVWACYLGIVAGLGATLILLAVWRKALPALPFSIALGVILYFVTRLLVDPFVVTLAAGMVYF